MKKTLFILITLIIFSACQMGNNEAAITFTLTNSSINSQKEAIIILRGDELKVFLGLMPQPFQITQGDKSILYQLDDTDFDGRIDELLIMDDFEAEQTKTYQIVKTKTQPEFKKRTNIHFAKKSAPDKELIRAIRLTPNDLISSTSFQMEGPAWENDKVGFRNYFDQRNGMDIFGKKIKELALHKAGIGAQNYHELSNWGMDVLKVGASLGAGAIALKKGDKIYRIDSGKPATYRLMKKGVLRSSFELKFIDFRIGEHTYQISHRVSIEAGKNYYQSEVTIEGLTGQEELVTGIVNLHSDTLYSFDVGYSTILYTHDLQSENKDTLGMALIIPDAQFIRKETAPESGEGIVSTYLATLKLEEGKPTCYYFYAGWQTQQQDFGQREYFEKALRTATEELNQSIIFKVEK